MEKTWHVTVFNIVCIWLSNMHLKHNMLKIQGMILPPKSFLPDVITSHSFTDSKLLGSYIFLFLSLSIPN